MPSVTFIFPNGEEQLVEIPNGRSVMRGAQAAGIPGIVGECGGSAICATCHVFVDEAFIGRVGQASVSEYWLLDSSRRETSRLSCQITMSPKLDGLVVRVASSA
ncbi:MAG: 2Fe-2S iron-sulfur cluster-binding protein [Sphingomonadaceae bacterium]